jgi:hypothetical protein
LIETTGVGSTVVLAKPSYGKRDRDLLPQTSGLFQSERRQHCAHNFAERDWGLRAGLNRSDESLPLAAMPLVLVQKRAEHARLSTADELESPKVFQYCHVATTKNLDSLL